MAKEVQNPWLNISWDNTIADCDKGFLVKKKSLLYVSVDWKLELNQSATSLSQYE